MMNTITVTDMVRIVQDASIEELAGCFALVRPLANEPDRLVVELWSGSQDVGVLICDERMEVGVPEKLWMHLSNLEPALGLARRRHVRCGGAMGKDHYSVQWLRMFLRGGRAVEDYELWECFEIKPCKLHLFRANGSDVLQGWTPNT